MKRLVENLSVHVILIFLCTYLTFFPAWLPAKVLHHSSTGLAPSNLTSLTPVIGKNVISSMAFPKHQNCSSDQEGYEGDGYYVPFRLNDQNELVIEQNGTIVVIPWSSFNIGENVHTIFNQQAGQTAVNKIYDEAPSKIFGRLSADGNIYLINPNGILFGRGSRTNVNSLIATTMDLDEDVYIQGLSDGEYRLHFSYNGEIETPDGLSDTDQELFGKIVNQGQITTGSNSQVFLLASHVENAGKISAGDGSYVYLSGADEFSWDASYGGGESLTTELETDFTGEAVNAPGAQILADVSQVGIFGKVVRQEGNITCRATLQKNGSVRLAASEKIVTGTDSYLDASHKPILDENGEEEEIAGLSASKETKVTISTALDSSFNPVGDPIAVYHQGVIYAPSGTVSIMAGDNSLKDGEVGRIYLGPESVIDVSGYWVENKSAEDKVISAQLNSLELRDEFIQKNGDLLGETVYFLAHEGIGIGNISTHLENRILSVQEWNTEGGIIDINAGRQGVVIAAEDSLLDFGGGGISYNAGMLHLTYLVSEGLDYSISDAPSWLEYSSFINTGTSTNDNYLTWVPAHEEGADAGTLKIVGQSIAYEGKMIGSATRGLYQVNTEELTDSLGYQKTIGTIIPESGILEIGKINVTNDFDEVRPILSSIVITNRASGLSSSFDHETTHFPEEREGQTWLYDEMLNKAGLGTIKLSATTTLSIKKRTEISLAPGGSFEGYARRIIHQGAIIVPAGSVVLETLSNESTIHQLNQTNEAFWIDVSEIGRERVELASGSSINTAGENYNLYKETAIYSDGGQMPDYLILDAGSITLKDTTIGGDGVVLRSGSEIDFSGGYLIDENRRIVDSGDAGSLSVQGEAIILDSELKGFAMVGSDGGEVTLHARQVRVKTSETPELPEGYSSNRDLPAAYRDKLIIGDNRFDDTGITNINLKSMTDLTVGENVSLSPSRLKSAVSLDGMDTRTMTVPMEYVGESAITLAAGVKENISDIATETDIIKIEKNTEITVAPGGSIEVSGPVADISGTYRAPAGNIDISATLFQALSNDKAQLFIREDARFYAAGINRKTTELVDGNFLIEPENGGDVSFSSADKLEMENGVLVDVSGSTPVLQQRRLEGGWLEAYVEASEPGSVHLSFKRSVDNEGQSLLNAGFKAEKYIDTLRGGEFTLESLDNLNTYRVRSGLIKGLERNGFDHLTLISDNSLEFIGNQTVDMERAIILDTPRVNASGNKTLTLNTAWLQLQNNGVLFEEPTLSGNGKLIANTINTDIAGDIKLSGFSNVSINAGQDIRLSDIYYTEAIETGNTTPSENKQWSGLLDVPGNLKLTAARIYPETASSFELKAGGEISTRSSGRLSDSPIYSALGSLTLTAESIDHRGNISAPLGQITLQATGRIFLADGSILSVKGELPVNYGVVDDTNLKWYGYAWDDEGNKIETSQSTEIESLSEKQIVLKGLDSESSELIQMPGSEINIEGGGVAFGYTFISGIDGSIDPLMNSDDSLVNAVYSDLINDKYVILPYDSAFGNLPGQAVYLEENDMVAAGLYTLLDAKYAFLEGAMILEVQGSLTPGAEVAATTKEGYTVALGFEADKLTGLHSSEAQIYTIREAADVLKEGYYEIVGLESGNGGSLVASASTNIMAGTISAGALNSTYRSGSVSFSGTEVVFTNQTPTQLTSGFKFNTRLDSSEQLQQLQNRMYLNAGELSSAGFWEVSIGDEITEKIVFENGSRLEGSKITLTTTDGNIEMGENSQIYGTGDEALVQLNIVSSDGSNTGGLQMHDTAGILSDYAIVIDAPGIDRGEGTISAEIVMQISSDYLFLTDSANTQDFLYQGFVIDEPWLAESFSALEVIQLIGREAIGFAGDIDLTATNASLLVDTPLLANNVTGTGDVDIRVDEAYFLNSSDETVDVYNEEIGEYETLKAQTDRVAEVYTGRTGSFDVAAARMYVGHGNVRFSGFSSMGLSTTHNLTFLGEGSLNTYDSDLNLESALVTGSYFTETDDLTDDFSYEALDFSVLAGSGRISVTSSQGLAEDSNNIGGRLTFTADRIDNYGQIEVNSGTIQFTATGEASSGSGIFMQDGSGVSATGSYDSFSDTYYDGGTIIYEADNGEILLAENSTTDVSVHADDRYGNAGTIEIYNPDGPLAIDGELSGEARDGSEGEFFMDTRSLADINDDPNNPNVDRLNSLVAKLSTGGFGERMDIRVRENSETLSLAGNVSTRNFRLSVDEGNVDITQAQVFASGSDGQDGGTVEIYSGGRLLLSENTGIYANTTDMEMTGGQVILGSGTAVTDGSLQPDENTLILGGATIDVSAPNEDNGGSIYFRVSRNEDNTDIRLDADVNIIGASQVTAEGVMVYTDDNIRAGDITLWRTNANSFINAINSAGGIGNGINVIAGVEVQSSGDMEVSQNINLSGFTFNGSPGVLTFRAAGSLNINSNVLDTRTAASLLQLGTAPQQTVSMNFAAGASLSNPDLFAVNRGGGDLVVDDATIYTESGNINFASGGNTEFIRTTASGTDYMTTHGMTYNLASHSGSIRGKIAGDLILDGGVIQTATGNIDLDVKENLKQIKNNTEGVGIGTIRTIGLPSVDVMLGARVDKGFEYSGGGDIRIRAGGDIMIQKDVDTAPKDMSLLDHEAWDAVVDYIEVEYNENGIPIGFSEEKSWSPSLSSSLLYGTTLTVTQGIATIGGGDVEIISGGNVFGQIGTFNTGDLTITAGGDINGRFLNRQGEASLSAIGNIGNMSSDQVVEVFDSQVLLNAMGNITLGSVANPALATSSYEADWNLQYTEDTSLSMTSRLGSISLTGLFPTIQDGQSSSSIYRYQKAARVLAPSVALKAGRDIIFKQNFYMPPSSEGTLELIAGRHITGEMDAGEKGGILMSDMSTDDVYGEQEIQAQEMLTMLENPENNHAAEPVHKDSETPATIIAGKDIKYINLAIPKAASIYAGRDILNINYWGQNIDSEDETTLFAGRNILFDTLKGESSTDGIEVYGPGLLRVQVGNNIDLGSSLGIRAMGTYGQSHLEEGTNNLMVIAGISDEKTVTELNQFFDNMRQAGEEWGNAWEAGDTDLADQIIAEARELFVDPLFESSEGTGNIGMVNSQIITRGGDGSIFTIAGGEINVGLSSIDPPPILNSGTSTETKNTGVYTTKGGPVRMYAKNDINVNVSRVMTFSGGDIDIISDQGNIKAGRGSKAASASGANKLKRLEDENGLLLGFEPTFEPPAVGSGIRATALTVALAGDIYPTAWEGNIDAGEAGIAGRNVIINAQEVFNAQNIQATGFSSGFTKPSDSSADLGAFSGSGGLAEGSLAAEESASMDAARKKMNEELPEGYSVEPRWVDVEVIGFEEEKEQE